MCVTHKIALNKQNINSTKWKNDNVQHLVVAQISVSFVLTYTFHWRLAHYYHLVPICTSSLKWDRILCPIKLKINLINFHCHLPWVVFFFDSYVYHRMYEWYGQLECEFNMYVVVQDFYFQLNWSDCLIKPISCKLFFFYSCPVLNRWTTDKWHWTKKIEGFTWLCEKCRDSYQRNPCQFNYKHSMYV